MPGLEELVARARAARVADDDARAYVAELGRWGRVAPQPRPRPAWWLGGGLVLAAAAIVIVMMAGRRPAEVAIGPVRVGEQVVVAPESGATYRVTAVDGAHTEIHVDSGTVTARLFHGVRPHDLTLVGGGVRARATGTVFSLTVDAGRGQVDVHEGEVRVERGAQTDTVVTGQVWPPAAARRGRRGGEALIALAPLPRTTDPATPADAGVADAAAVVTMDASDDAGPTSADAAPPPPRDAVPRLAPADAAPVESLNDRWRRARLFRGQGDFAAAIAECLAIADERDLTWSPIALLEAARIELGPRASPERAIVLAERFEREWAAHQLAPEARELRCRALRQLGRDAECAKAP